MKHLGDITKIDGYSVPVVDCVIGGSPCQDLSIAGKRAGLDGERSGLYMEQIRLVKEMRLKDEHNGRTGVDVRPRYMVWENVPGAFSSNKGEDFRIVLEELAKIKDKDATIPMPDKGKWTTSGGIVGDGWSIAWRVLDAQFWGVPQRRRRIALVADFGGQSAPEILFVGKSLSGHTDESKPKRKETATDAPRGIGTDDSERVLCFEPGAAKRLGGYVWEEIAPTLRTEVGDNRPSVAYTAKIRGGCEGGGKGALVQTDKSVTLSTLQDQILFQPVCSYNIGDRFSIPYELEEKSHTLTARCGTGGNNVPAVVCIENHPQDSRVGINEDGIVQTLSSRMGTGGGNVPMVMQCYSKQRRAQSSEDFETWKESDTANTLNAFDIGDVRTTEAVVYAVDQGGGKSSANVSNGTAPTLTCTHGGEPAVVYASYQDKVGALCARDYKGVGSQYVEEDKLVCYCLQGGGTTSQNSQGIGYAKDKSYTINTIDRHAIVRAVDCREAYPQEIHDFVAENNADAPHQQDLLQTADGVARTLAPGTHAAGSHLTKTIIRVGTKYIVRRLTPLECERLQGYPDGWTDIGDWTDSKGKVHKSSDASRYKALGNSIALPPWKWVLKRICACYERDATMASLFDGIGGFPYLWEQLNGKGTCLWASEIEEFPMAVTKVRIG